MTVNREFSCDICQDRIPDHNGGIGIKYTGPDVMRSTMISDSERHLCNRCCQCLKDMFGDLDAEAADRVARSADE
jgi:hypothetical protein